VAAVSGSLIKWIESGAKSSRSANKIHVISFCVRAVKEADDPSLFLRRTKRD